MMQRFDSTHILEMGGGRARARLRIPAHSPPLDTSGAIVTVGQAAAMAAASSAMQPGAALAAAPHMQPVQMSVNLFREMRPGTLTAEAQTIFQSRNTLIVDVKVRDEHAQLVATLAVTQLAPRAAAAGLDRTSARLAS
jgi:acyl-coenzyme A thioesterase PaaI-like protein